MSRSISARTLTCTRPPTATTASITPCPKAATAHNPKEGYGYHVRILHPDDSRTIYAHLQEGGLLVATGQNVRMGDVIGKSGNTGRSSGPHLHFGAFVRGAKVDPLMLIEATDGLNAQ